MSRSPTNVCSECGHPRGGDRDASRTRRRWRVAAFGLLVALALPAFVVQRRIRAFGWRYYTVVGPIYWLSPRWTVGEWAIGDATLRISEDRRRDFFLYDFSLRRATLTRAGRTVWSIEDDDVEAGLPQVIDAVGDDRPAFGPAVDVDGDGRPECVVRGVANGSGHFSRTFILRLNADGTVTNLTRGVSLDGEREDGLDSVVGVADLRGDATNALVVYDPTFAYWRTSHAGSPHLWVALERRGDAYVASADLTRRLPAPTTAEVREAVVACRATAWPRPAATYDIDDDLYSPLLGTMGGPIYAGRSDEAYAFLDAAWPGDAASRATFAAEFRDVLSGSPYADMLVALGHPPFEVKPLAREEGRR